MFSISFSFSIYHTHFPGIDEHDHPHSIYALSMAHMEWTILSFIDLHICSTVPTPNVLQVYLNFFIYLISHDIIMYNFSKYSINLCHKYDFFFYVHGDITPSAIYKVVSLWLSLASLLLDSLFSFPMYLLLPISPMRIITYTSQFRSTHSEHS